jgi:hypothetical protein
MREDRPSLHWSVKVDYATGEPNYPIGWPRINHPIPEGAARDWSAWDYLHVWILAETSRPALPRVPAGLLLYAPDRAGEVERPLSGLKKGEWVEIIVPVAQIPRAGDVRLFQLFLSEADYRDHDQLDLYIDDLALLRYSRPVLLEFAPESAAMFADRRRIPVRFRLAGIRPGESAGLVCELRRQGHVAARASVRAGRGVHELVLDLGGKALPPGAYELTALVAGSQQMAKASLRLVPSPWRPR